MTRYPALVLALVWSATVTAAVVLAPDERWLGFLAIAVAVPFTALALFLRPALIALALAVALAGVARVELPAADPLTQARAQELVGATAVITGHVADDSRPIGGGGEVLVEPDQIQLAGGAATGIGNLMVQAVKGNDLPLIQGIALIFCVLMLTITIVVDVLYAVLNPRMRNL